MPQLKWHNLCIGLRLSINTGVGLVFWAAGFFLLTHMASESPAVERLYPVALAGWMGGFVSFLLKRNANNKIDERLKIAKNGFTSVEK